MRAPLAALAALLLFLVGAPLLGLMLSLSSIAPLGSAVEPSPLALADIPAQALRNYQEAAPSCPGLSWTVLAGIGKVESDHGRSGLPGVSSGQNSAGAMGPMQFLAATWAAYHLPGMADVYDHRHAAFAAARYLCASGAGVAARLRQAIWAYNQAWWYVDEVLDWAGQYAAQATQLSIAGLGRPGDPFAGACRALVTQPYGPTSLVGEPIIEGRRFHTGIDLACPAGTPVHSLSQGLAWSSSESGGYGNSVVVELETRLPGDLVPQRYFIRYAHLLDEVPVASGGVVHAGDVIGLVGSSGFSTGPHLHFEIDRGQLGAGFSIDPGLLLELR